MWLKGSSTLGWPRLPAASPARTCKCCGRHPGPCSWPLPLSCFSGTRCSGRRTALQVQDRGSSTPKLGRQRRRRQHWQAGRCLDPCLGRGSAQPPLTCIQVAVHPGVGSRALALVGHTAGLPCPVGCQQPSQLPQLDIQHVLMQSGQAEAVQAPREPLRLRAVGFLEPGRACRTLVSTDRPSARDQAALLRPARCSGRWGEVVVLHRPRAPPVSHPPMQLLLLIVQGSQGLGGRLAHSRQPHVRQLLRAAPAGAQQLSGLTSAAHAAVKRCICECMCIKCASTWSSKLSGHRMCNLCRLQECQKGHCRSHCCPVG